MYCENVPFFKCIHFTDNFSQMFFNLSVRVLSSANYYGNGKRNKETKWICFVWIAHCSSSIWKLYMQHFTENSWRFLSQFFLKWNQKFCENMEFLNTHRPVQVKKYDSWKYTGLHGIWKCFLDLRKNPLCKIERWLAHISSKRRIILEWCPTT